MKCILLSLIAVSLLGCGKVTVGSSRYTEQDEQVSPIENIVGKTVQSVYAKGSQVIINFSDGQLLLVEGYKYDLEVTLK